MMQIRYGILNLLRAWKKTLVFFLLLSVVTAAVALASGVCQSAVEFLQRCREGYVTIARFTYEASDCGPESYDPAVWEAADQLTLPDTVLEWDPNRTAAGLLAGVTRTDKTAFGSDAAVVVVRVNSYDSHLGIYSATVSESLYSRMDRTGQMIFLVHEDPLEVGHKYLIHGEWFRGYSGIINLGIREFEHPSAAVAGLDGSASAMILDVTDGSEDRSNFEMLADYYRETSSFITVTATENLEALYPFQQNQLTIAQGNAFVSGDGMVCVISDQLAWSMNWKVGDQVELSISVPGEGGLYGTYWPGTGYDAVETFTICGLFEGTADQRHQVFIPADSVAVMEYARCGTVLGQARISGDQIDNFCAYMESALPSGVRFVVLDQGYAAAAAPFREILRSAVLILAACLAVGLAVLMLFGYLFVYRQRAVLKNMVRLGAGRSARLCYFLGGAGLLAFFGALSGALAANAASGQVSRWLVETLKNYTAEDLRYSISNLSVRKELAMMPSMESWVFFVTAAVMWLCAAGTCLGFVIWLEKPSGQRGGGRIHRGRSHGLRGGSWKFAWLSVLRGGGRSLTPLCAVFCGVLLLGYLPYAQQDYQVQMDHMRQDTVILGYLTNDNAQLSNDININGQQLRVLMESGVVEDLTVTKNSHYLVSDGTIQQPQNGYQMETLVKKILSRPQLISTNRLDMCPEFRYADVTVRWLDGYDAGALELRELDREWRGPYRVVASEGFLITYGLELGDVLELWYNVGDDTAASVKVELIGAYTAEHDRQNLYLELGFIFGPGWKNAFDRMSSFRRDPLSNISFHSAGFRFSAGSLETVKDTLEELGFSQPGQFDRERRWVVLDDRDFLDRQESMVRRMRYMELLFPVVYVILECLAVAASWVLTMYHRRDLAVMRGQGASRTTAFFSVFWNQTMICLSAATLAAGVLALMGIWTDTGLLLAGAFLALWLLGSGVAVAAMNCRQIVAILKAAE